MGEVPLLTKACKAHSKLAVSTKMDDDISKQNVRIPQEP